MKRLFLAYCLLFIAFLPGPIHDDKLRELNDRLSKCSVDNINEGGCGYAALYIYDYLGSEQIIRFYNKHYSRIHIMVKHGKYYIDGTGMYTTTFYLAFNQASISRNELVNMLKERYRWNNSFNISDTIFIKYMVFGK